MPAWFNCADTSIYQLRGRSTCSVWAIHSKRRSFNSHIATSSDRQVPFGDLRHFCKLHRGKTLSRLFSKVANSLHWQPYKSLPPKNAFLRKVSLLIIRVVYRCIQATKKSGGLVKAFYPTT